MFRTRNDRGEVRTFVVLGQRGRMPGEKELIIFNFIYSVILNSAKDQNRGGESGANKTNGKLRLAHSTNGVTRLAFFYGRGSAIWAMHCRFTPFSTSCDS